MWGGGEAKLSKTVYTSTIEPLRQKRTRPAARWLSQNRRTKGESRVSLCCFRAFFCYAEPGVRSNWAQNPKRPTSSDYEVPWSSGSKAPGGGEGFRLRVPATWARDYDLGTAEKERTPAFEASMPRPRACRPETYSKSQKFAKVKHTHSKSIAKVTYSKADEAP